ncbi:helix-turn-helix domain-containing protein [Comamonas thiooxydans]|uniref:helix-turn-helix domain-containing protein n=1 Tax=Comamonas thiooxydans TaxID=363952 RepID=UPI001E2F33AB|nr:LysR family transcriptional regulator [Comamonas thiooxydans]
MDIVTHVQTFVAVVRYGNFSEAARHLGVVPSVIAKRVSQLETEPPRVSRRPIGLS